VEVSEEPEEIIEDETIDWQTYRNEKWGFEMKYPRHWHIEEEKEEGVHFGIAFMDTGESLLFMVYREPSEIEARAALDELLEQAREQGVEIKEIIIDSTRGYKTVDSFGFSAYTVKDNYFYWFQSLFFKELLFDQILSTFRFLE